MTITDLTLAISLAGSTFILEDAAILTGGILVSQDKLSFTVAYVALLVGIAGGDYLLFIIGRLRISRKLLLKSAGKSRMMRANRLLRKHAAKAVIVARFIPGLRLPTYLLAGTSKVNSFRFLSFVLLASSIWTLIILQASTLFGRAITPILKKFQLSATIVIITVVLLSFVLKYFKNRSKA